MVADGIFVYRKVCGYLPVAEAVGEGGDDAYLTPDEGGGISGSCCFSASSKAKSIPYGCIIGFMLFVVLVGGHGGLAGVHTIKPRNPIR